MSDSELVAAGRAAIRYLTQTKGRHLVWTNSDCEPVAQAVLNALGIKLDGWEWRVVVKGGWVPHATDQEAWDHARRELTRMSDVRVQRRRKVTTEWEDAE